MSATGVGREGMVNTSRTRGHAFYLVGLLLACYTFSYIDRQAISLVVQPLKAALALTDTQIGLVQGFAFTICYAVTGIPLARAIDRHSRVRIIAACVAIWSVATMVCGLVSGYGAFLAARSATAISEAGLPPAALSLMTDVTSRRRLAWASTLFMTGPYLGGGIALLGGGWLLGLLTRAGGLTLPLIGQLPPWKALFVCVGAPALLLAVLVAITLREPPRAEPEIVLGTGPAIAHRPLRAYLRVHWVWLMPYLLGTTCLVAVLFAVMAWMPTYFVRTFHLSAQAAGRTIGPVYLLVGMGGSIAAGWLAAGMNPARTVCRVLRIVLCAAVVIVPAGWMFGQAASAQVATISFAVISLACSAVVALAPLPIQLTAPSAARGQVTAIFAFVYAAVAGGGGPFAVGYITDHVLSNELLIGRSLEYTALGAAVLGVALCWIGLRQATVRLIVGNGAS